ncbi:aldose 1-epimerase [Tamlana sp. 62-3]|uniref:Aldose 1-epimerase n=1 Tax=Neotamlana sargassicola TaxID=2883125 RepID=A0A9X1I6S3_9FLAO|nr:aldose 1-epimerase [Tamlana sargassicola]MCB4807835.1 aldose 1-epimerase [Tamlana sargassicola]
MFQISHNKTLNILEIAHSNKKLFAKINLNDGASLQECTLNANQIIKDLAPLKYENTYASSILFPFANRIKDGEYKFEGKIYKFDINEPKNNNALHGLVFNKTFNIVSTKASENEAHIVLLYSEMEKHPAFPYTYNITITYTFTRTTVSLNVIIKNTSNNTFPFTLGWHPYFSSENLYQSNISFNSLEKIELDDRNITSGVKPAPETDFKIKNKTLDDCWILNSDEIVFKTPAYKLQFNSNAKQNFLQIYTPPAPNTIAIEPTTGVSNSFNNQIGLQLLGPDQSEQITWTITID